MILRCQPSREGLCGSVDVAGGGGKRSACEVVLRHQHAGSDDGPSSLGNRPAASRRDDVVISVNQA